MNKGQEDFLGFMLKQVASENHGEVKELLHDAFKMHDEGKFNLGELGKLAPKLHALATPENLDAVKGAMEHFAKSLK